MSSLRKRFIQESARSTTQRRAEQPGMCALSNCSSFRLRMLATYPALVTMSRHGWLSYPASRQRCCGCSVLGAGRGITVASRVAANSVRSGRLAPATVMPMGIPPPSVCTLRFVPDLLRSVGFGPVISPPERRLGHAAVHALPTPVHAHRLVIRGEGRRPGVLEHARLFPLTKVVVERAGRAELLTGQGMPVDTRPQHEEDAGCNALEIHRARPATLRIQDRQPWLKQLPQLLRQFPRRSCRHRVQPRVKSVLSIMSHHYITVQALRGGR